MSSDNSSTLDSHSRAVCDSLLEMVAELTRSSLFDLVAARATLVRMQEKNTDITRAVGDLHQRIHDAVPGEYELVLMGSRGTSLLVHPLSDTESAMVVPGDQEQKQLATGKPSVHQEEHITNNKEDTTNNASELIERMRTLFSEYNPILLETKAGLKLLTMHGVPMRHFESGESLVASDALDKFEITIQTADENRKIRVGVAERLAYMVLRDPDFAAKYTFLMHYFACDGGKVGAFLISCLKRWLRIL